jgi:hypothetical protein
MHKSKLANILALSVVVFTAVMAINAATAQATIYKLNGGTESGGVLLLHLNLTWKLGEVLINWLGIHFHWSVGLGLLHIVTNSSMSSLTASGTTSFTGTKVVGFSNCTVQSPGAAPGEIKLKFEGPVSMSGTESFSNFASINFSEISFSGALCPFNELEGLLNGEMKLGLQGEGTAESHSGTLDDISGKLFYGEESAELHGSNLTTPIGLTAKKVGGGSWGIAL